MANHPVLSQEISNGHAARMRYSRVKKQMEPTSATPSPRKPRESKSPRKSKVEKNKGRAKRETRKKTDAATKFKLETPEMTPDVGGPAIKAESEMPATPPSQPSYLESPDASPSPGQSQQSFGHGHGMGEMDDMMTSFGMPGDNGMFPPMMSGGFGSGMSPMGMEMGIGVDPFDNMWQQGHVPEGHEGMSGESGVHVKKEPRWDDAYRHT